MNHYGNSIAPAVSENGNCTGLSAPQPTKVAAQDDVAVEYATIDGEMINSAAGTDAVRKGNGMFIGDYFVGILDSFASISSKPYLRY